MKREKRKSPPIADISDEEEAEIQRQIAPDPDDFELTDEMAAQGRPFAEMFPELAEKMRRNIGGRPRLEHPKKSVHLRLDQDVVDKFKATGPGWQTRINEVLKAAKV
jgi:uncharacterized protein (DUF4415 family)